MARHSTFADAGAADVAPRINVLSPSDLREALRRGYADFSAKPSHPIFLSIIYPVISFLLIQAAAGRDLWPLIYPLIAGFALVGPLAAIGLYELSRRRERGEEARWRDAFAVFRSPALANIVTLGAILTAIFLLWLYAAQALYLAIMGPPATHSLTAFFSEILTTERGWLLILAGNAVGFVFACLAFVLSVVSFPLLLDRNVDLRTAVATSVRVVARNPRVMALWGVIVSGGLVLGFLPAGIGLAIVLPIL
ncbi:MAG: DUF2189 domain-containing protein, partial [Alphaproteobacteria bacterium]